MRRCELRDFENLFGDYTFEYSNDDKLSQRREAPYFKRIGRDRFFDSYVIAHYPETIMFNGRDGGKMVIASVQYVEYDEAERKTTLFFCCGSGKTVAQTIPILARKLNY